MVEYFIDDTNTIITLPAHCNDYNFVKHYKKGLKIKKGGFETSMFDKRPDFVIKSEIETIFHRLGYKIIPSRTFDPDFGWSDSVTISKSLFYQILNKIFKH